MCIIAMINHLSLQFKYMIFHIFIYSTLNARVKQWAREDKRRFVDNLATEAEPGSQKQELGTVYRITGQICGVSREERHWCTTSRVHYRQLKRSRRWDSKSTFRMYLIRRPRRSQLSPGMQKKTLTLALNNPIKKRSSKTSEILRTAKYLVKINSILSSVIQSWQQRYNSHSLLKCGMVRG